MYAYMEKKWENEINIVSNVINVEKQKKSVEVYISIPGMKFRIYSNAFIVLNYRAGKAFIKWK